MNAKGDIVNNGRRQYRSCVRANRWKFHNMGQAANRSRFKQMICPNGRIVRYEYTNTDLTSGLNDKISRLTFLADDNAGQVGTHLEEYSYVGLNTVVKRAHPEPGVDLSYINAPGGSSDGGDQYTGLDRFGRVLDQYWAQAGTGTDSFQYTYDRDSNRLMRNNLLRTILHDFDEMYSYDNFNQLTNFTRNAHSEGWGLDNLGNWKTFSNDQTGPPSETRMHNAQNQISTLMGTGLVTPAYDQNGNTTRDEWNNTYTFDAWNRLAQATVSSGTQTFTYDAVNRRIIENSGTARDLYYSKDWQVLEERTGGSMEYQNVWSPVYVDALVLRDSNTGQRLYVQQDANWNVTAIIGKPVTTWVVQERYAYDPYGKPTVLDASGVLRGSGAYGTSSFGWVYLHQGGRYTRFDDLSGLYSFRFRDYSPTMGRWMQEDPIAYWGGDSNLYRYLLSSPVKFVDPSGLDATVGTIVVGGATGTGGVVAGGAIIVTAGAGFGVGYGISYYVIPWEGIADWVFGNPKPVNVIDIAPPLPPPRPPRKTGDFSYEEWAVLQGLVKAYCNQPRRCTGNMTDLAELQLNVTKNLACAAARDAITKNVSPTCLPVTHTRWRLITPANLQRNVSVVLPSSLGRHYRNCLPVAAENV